MLCRVLPILAVLVIAVPVARANESFAIANDRLDGGRAHLWRNMVWGVASAAGGTALALTSDRDQHPTRWAFGLQTAIWGGIDIGIAGVGLYLLSGPPEERGVRATIAKERLFHDALLLNMGLDVGYIAVGAGMLIAARKEFDNAGEWRGHGAAIVIQGTALLAFEVVAWRGSRRRLGRLIDLTVAGDGQTLGLAGRF